MNPSVLQTKLGHAVGAIKKRNGYLGRADDFCQRVHIHAPKATLSPAGVKKVSRSSVAPPEGRTDPCSVCDNPTLLLKPTAAFLELAAQYKAAYARHAKSERVWWAAQMASDDRADMDKLAAELDRQTRRHAKAKKEFDSAVAAAALEYTDRSMEEAKRCARKREHIVALSKAMTAAKKETDRLTKLSSQTDTAIDAALAAARAELDVTYPAYTSLEIKYKKAKSKYLAAAASYRQARWPCIVKPTGGVEEFTVCLVCCERRLADIVQLAGPGASLRRQTVSAPSWLTDWKEDEAGFKNYLVERSQAEQEQVESLLAASDDEESDEDTPLAQRVAKRRRVQQDSDGEIDPDWEADAAAEDPYFVADP